MPEPKPKLLVLDPGDALSTSCRIALRREFDLDALGADDELLPAIEERAPHVLLIRVDSAHCSELAHRIRQIAGFDRELPIVLILSRDLSVEQRSLMLSVGILGHAGDEASGEELNAVLRQALKFSCLLLERRYLRDLFLEDVAQELRVLLPDLEAEIRAAAGSDAGLMIIGEPGSGRRDVARMIHQLSRRSQEAFVCFNPRALSAEECRWRLFGDGSRRGSWRHGLLETADSGTLLIEDLDALPSEVQAELGEAVAPSPPAGASGSRTLPAQARIMGTTHPPRGPASGTWSGMLGLPEVRQLTLPSLSGRKAEAFRLLLSWMDRYGRKYGHDQLEIDGDARSLMRRYSWPGGAAEIQRVAELAALRANGKTLTSKEFWVFGLDPETLPEDYKEAKKLVERHFKKEFFQRLLMRSEGRVSSAALRCGLPRPSLSTMLKETGLCAADYKRQRRARAAKSTI